MDFLQTINEWAWIVWIVLIALFLVIEILTLDFTFVMLGAGGAAGLGSSLLGAPLWLQVIIAALVAAVLILTLRPPLLRRLRRGEHHAPTNVDALRGMNGIALSPLTRIGGQVRLSNGDTWTARAADEHAIDRGSAVVVTRIDGATAVVRSDRKDHP